VIKNFNCAVLNQLVGFVLRFVSSSTELLILALIFLDTSF